MPIRSLPAISLAVLLLCPIGFAAAEDDDWYWYGYDEVYAGGDSWFEQPAVVVQSLKAADSGSGGGSWYGGSGWGFGGGDYGWGGAPAYGGGGGG